MELILRDGIQYVEHPFDLESVFEDVVFQQYKHLFGQHSLPMSVQSAHGRKSAII